MSARGAVGMAQSDRDAIIVLRWREGVASEDIAASVGMAPRQLRERIRRMRRKGVDLPSRSTIGRSSQGNGGGRQARPQRSAAGTPGARATARATPGQRGGHPEGLLDKAKAHNLASRFDSSAPRGFTLYCRCGHSAMMHDSGGGCQMPECRCRGFANA